MVLEGFGERIGAAFASFLLKLNRSLERQVLGSGIARSIGEYSLKGLIVVVATVASSSLPLAYILYLKGFSLVKAAVAAVLAGVMAFSVSLAAVIALPSILYKSRASKLEPRFPLIASALATRLMAGMNLSSALLDLKERDLEMLREFKVELEYLSSAIKSGVEASKALDFAASITPSRSLRNLFSSLSMAARTGTGVSEVIDTLLREYLFSVETEIDKVTSSLGALIELFVSVSVMLPIAIGVVGLLLLFKPAGAGMLLDFRTILFVSTFMLVPAVAVGVVVVADSMISRIRI